MGNATPKDGKKVAPAKKLQDDMSGSVKTNPGRIEDDESRATKIERPYSEYKENGIGRAR